MSSEAGSFKLEIFTPEKTQVYLSCPTWTKFTSLLVKTLDESSIRAVGDVTGLHDDTERVRRIMSECSGVIAMMPFQEGNGCTTDARRIEDLRIAGELGIPLAIFIEDNVSLQITHASGFCTLQFGTSLPFTTRAESLCGPIRYPGNSDVLPLDSLGPFLAAVHKAIDPIRPFAFYIGRLERDFTQAREAIRAAIENDMGIPFLWADDGRHRTNVESVRERTRLLLKHARFVIADLTLGVESPDHENPSRAHEIGLSIAYDRKLLLLSQEPRRYPYFSVSDLQVVFWSTEADLELKVKEWVRNHRDCFGRNTWNYNLLDSGYKPKIAPAQFRYHPATRYIGPRTPRRFPWPQPAVAAFGVIGLLAILTVLILLAGAMR